MGFCQPGTVQGEGKTGVEGIGEKVAQLVDHEIKGDRKEVKMGVSSLIRRLQRKLWNEGSWRLKSKRKRGESRNQEIFCWEGVVAYMWQHDRD